MEQNESQKQEKQIRAALLALGYQHGAKVQIKHISKDRCKVTVNGDYIGIYDLTRGTFVD